MMQGHCLVNDEFRQLIRNEDKSEPAEDDFGFASHENTPNSSTEKKRA
jgi:hypothetical protein